MYSILTDNNFQKEVLENPQPVLVEISADWCGTCHIMAPVLKKLAAEFEGQIKFGRLDADANERTAKAYGMRELPMLLFFKDGQLVDYVMGVVSKSALEARIKTLLQTEE
jgi:thioredoxin 1